MTCIPTPTHNYTMFFFCFFVSLTTLFQCFSSHFTGKGLELDLLYYMSWIIKQTFLLQIRKFNNFTSWLNKVLINFVGKTFSWNKCDSEEAIYTMLIDIVCVHFIRPYSKLNSRSTSTLQLNWSLSNRYAIRWQIFLHKIIRY